YCVGWAPPVFLPRGGGFSRTPWVIVSAQKKFGVRGGVWKERKKKKAKPPYPAIAKNARASGAVQVQILISETGEVIDATVIAGHPVLRDAALQAARQWVFKPTELSGVAG